MTSRRRYVPPMNRTVLILLMGLCSFLLASCNHVEPPASKLNPAEAGRGLRQMMLTTPPAEFGEKPTKDFPRVYGILMDLPVGERIATIFSSSTGAASIYTTSTFGVLGGEMHETVRAAAIRFVRAADHFFESATPTTEYPYPAAGRVRFYLLTFEGVRFIDTDLASIENGTSEYAELFGLGQEVITELRLLTENPNDRTPHQAPRR